MNFGVGTKPSPYDNTANASSGTVKSSGEIKLNTRCCSLTISILLSKVRLLLFSLFLRFLAALHAAVLLRLTALFSSFSFPYAGQCLNFVLLRCFNQSSFFVSFLRCSFNTFHFGSLYKCHSLSGTSLNSALSSSIRHFFLWIAFSNDLLSKDDKSSTWSCWLRHPKPRTRRLVHGLLRLKY